MLGAAASMGGEASGETHSGLSSSSSVATETPPVQQSETPRKRVVFSPREELQAKSMGEQPGRGVMVQGAAAGRGDDTNRSSLDDEIYVDDDTGPSDVDADEDIYSDDFDGIQEADDDSEDELSGFEKDAEEAIKKAESDTVSIRPGSGSTRLRSAGSIRPDSAARSRPPSAHQITPRDDYTSSRPNSAREFQQARKLTPRSYNDELEKELAKIAAERARGEGRLTPRTTPRGAEC